MMTIEKYENNYINLKIDDYEKMTKKELLEIANSFLQALDDNVCHRFIAPSGDDWLGSDEIRYQVKEWFKFCRIEKVPCMSKIKSKKELLAKYVVALDIAYNQMYEVISKHSYHYYLGHKSKHYGFITLSEILKG